MTTWRGGGPQVDEGGDPSESASRKEGTRGRRGRGSRLEDDMARQVDYGMRIRGKKRG